MLRVVQCPTALAQMILPEEGTQREVRIGDGDSASMHSLHPCALEACCLTGTVISKGGMVGERPPGHVMLTCGKGYEGNKHGAIVNGST